MENGGFQRERSIFERKTLGTTKGGGKARKKSQGDCVIGKVSPPGPFPSEKENLRPRGKGLKNSLLAKRGAASKRRGWPNARGGKRGQGREKIARTKERCKSPAKSLKT